MLHFHGWLLSKRVQNNKMASGKDGFLFEDDLNSVLAIIDADMFGNEDIKL